MQQEGQHDFDFLFGRWRVHHRKLADQTDRACTDWIEFDSVAEARATLAGLGNVDFVSGTLPAGTSFEGMSVRLFEPATGTWRIWWASTANPGHLDAPVAGRFRDGNGIFHGKAHLGDVPIVMQFEWSEITDNSARWSQRFSYNDGQSWDPENWIMTLKRL